MTKSFSVLLALALFTTAAQAAQPVRKALITCDFINGIGGDGKLDKFKDGQLSYNIDLDAPVVELNCVGRETCLLDGGPQPHRLVTPVTPEASFVPIILENGRFSSFSSNMPALNIEGANGDDMDMFTRITFSPKNSETLSATAVLIYADEGNDGIVSAPTACTVELL